jgi:hypothetical protein
LVAWETRTHPRSGSCKRTLAGTSLWPQNSICFRQRALFSLYLAQIRIRGQCSESKPGRIVTPTFEVFDDEWHQRASSGYLRATFAFRVSWVSFCPAYLPLLRRQPSDQRARLFVEVTVRAFTGWHIWSRSWAMSCVHCRVPLGSRLLLEFPKFEVVQPREVHKKRIQRVVSTDILSDAGYGTLSPTQRMIAGQGNATQQDRAHPDRARTWIKEGRAKKKKFDQS